QWRRPPQRRARLFNGDGDGRGDGRLDPRLLVASETRGALAPMSGGPAVGTRAPGALETISGADDVAEPKPRRHWGAPWAWVVFIIGALYFFVPLIATFEVSMRAKPLFAAYTNSFKDPGFLSSLLYSFVIGLITVVLSIALIV